MSNPISAGAKLVHTATLLCGLMGASMSLVPATGCTASEMAEPEDTNPAMKTFTGASNGQKVAVNEGDLFEVRLEANPSTGYEWNVVTQNKDVLESEGEPKFARPDKAPPGTPSQQVFRFKAVRPDNTSLTLHYARPWEKNKQPIEVFSLQITVRKATG